MYIKQSLPAYNSLTGIYSVIKNGSGNDMQLTLDADACDVAYKALSNYKAGTVGVINYKTGETLVMTSTPSYDPQNKPSDIDDNDAYSGAYINRLLTGLYTPGSTFKIVTEFAQLKIFLIFMTRNLEMYR